MKTLKSILALLTAVSCFGAAVPINVQKTDGVTNKITADLVVGDGRTISATGTGQIIATGSVPSMAINLAASGAGGVTGNLPVTNLNSGTAAASDTFWAGDGTWKKAQQTSGSSLLAGNGSGGFTNVVLGSGLSYSSPNLTLSNIPVTALNGGTSAGATTFWRGDGTWATPAGGVGTVTSIGLTVPAFLSVTPSSITTSGTFAVTYSGTALPVANGGTGALTAALARTSLGLAIGTDVQAWSSNLDTWSAKTPYAGTLTITSGKTFSVENSIVLRSTSDGVALQIGGGGTLGTAAYQPISAFEVPLTFSTGLTRASNTVTANAVNLAGSGSGGVTGNLSASHLGGGTGASSTTFWRGDETWQVPNFEPPLGNPAVDGYVLASTVAGARYWVVNGSGGGGSGTVTSIPDGSTNGVIWTVATRTTTPTFTFSLGAITPTTVRGNTITTGTGTLTLGSVTLNAGSGGTLGTAAFTAASAYVPAYSGLTANGLLQATGATTVASTLTPAGLTSFNKVSITQPASGSTLTIVDGATLTASATATVSGTNTGDQTITLTGDVTGSGTGSFATTLASVASAGTTGSSTAIPVITIDAKGRTTSITTAAVVAPAGTLTGGTLAPGVTDSSLATLGPTVTIGAGGSGATDATIILSGSSANNRGPYQTFRRNGVDWAAQGTDSAINGGSGNQFTQLSGADFYWRGVGGQLMGSLSASSGNAMFLGTITLGSGSTVITDAAGKILTAAINTIASGLTGILPSANGGTGNSFTKFAGPTTSEKTVMIPDANLTITAAAATVLDDTTVGAMVDTLGGASATGTGGLARANSPVFVTPTLGTPASGVGTNFTGIPEGGLSLTDIATNNVSTTKHGFAPKAPNDATKFLDGTGAYSVPAGGAAVANPGSQVLGLTAINGSASTAMRSDGAPALDVTIAPNWSNQHIHSKSGAASITAETWSGVPFAGTGTTSFPLVYINDANATASTTLNTAGTYFGVNGDGTQDLINLMKDGVSQFKISSTGAASLTGALTYGTSITSSSSNGSILPGQDGYMQFAGRTSLRSLVDGSLVLRNNADNNFTILQFGGTTNSFNAIGRDTVNSFTIQSAAATATYNDAATAGSGTVANAYVLGIAAPTKTATNATVTHTVDSTFYIGGAPTASTNLTIGAAYALNVAAGTTLLQALRMGVAAPLSIVSGTNQRAGNATLTGGTVTVNNTTVTANSILMLTRKTSGGTIGTAITYTTSAATSFTINSDNILDTSVFSYFIVEVP